MVAATSDRSTKSCWRGNCNHLFVSTSVRSYQQVVISQSCEFIRVLLLLHPSGVADDPVRKHLMEARPLVLAFVGLAACRLTRALHRPGSARAGRQYTKG